MLAKKGMEIYFHSRSEKLHRNLKNHSAPGKIPLHSLIAAQDTHRRAAVFTFNPMETSVDFDLGLTNISLCSKKDFKSELLSQ